MQEEKKIRMMMINNGQWIMDNGQSVAMRHGMLLQMFNFIFFQNIIIYN